VFDFPLQQAPDPSIMGDVPSRSKRRPARRATRSPSPSSASSSRGFVTNPEGQRRAIILDMNYYLKLLAEVNTLRALVKQRSPAAGPARSGRRPAR